MPATLNRFNGLGVRSRIANAGEFVDEHNHEDVGGIGKRPKALSDLDVAKTAGGAEPRVSLLECIGGDRGAYGETGEREHVLIRGRVVSMDAHFADDFRRGRARCLGQRRHWAEA